MIFCVWLYFHSASPGSSQTFLRLCPLLGPRAESSFRDLGQSPSGDRFFSRLFILGILRNSPDFTLLHRHDRISPRRRGCSTRQQHLRDWWAWFPWRKIPGLDWMLRSNRGCVETGDPHTCCQTGFSMHRDKSQPRSLESTEKCPVFNVVKVLKAPRHIRTKKRKAQWSFWLLEQVHWDGLRFSVFSISPNKICETQVILFDKDSSINDWVIRN